MRSLVQTSLLAIKEKKRREKEKGREGKGKRNPTRAGSSTHL
jgi:hypothetical protein